MKSNLIFTVLPVVFILVSCIPADTVIPETATVIPTNTASQTPIPPETNTPEATATETVAVLTPRKQEFLDQGYDELSSLEDGVIYGILDESSVEYMSDGGVEFGEGGHALSTVEVDYYNPETKQFERGKFVIDWSVETPNSSYITYPTDIGGAGGAPIVISQFLVKSAREQYFDFSTGKTPFVKLMFKYKIEGVDPLNDFFDSAFPEFKGKVEFVTIPGIGKVMTVKGAVPEGLPDW